MYKLTLTFPALLAVVLLVIVVLPRAQVSTDGPKYDGPDGHEIVNAHRNDFRDLLDRFPRDRGTVDGGYPSKIEPRRLEALEAFYQEWYRVMKRMDFDGMNRSGKVDYLLFHQRLKNEHKSFQREAEKLRKAGELIPFIEEITALEYRKRALEEFDVQKLAPQVEALAKKVEKQRKVVAGVVRVSRAIDTADDQRIPEPIFKAAEDGSRELQRLVDNWFNFYKGYEPNFSWWMNAPSKRLAAALGAYADTFKPPERRPAPPKEEPTVEGFNGENHVKPVGPERLKELLREEMIPYSAAELVALGRKELAWCVEQQKKYSKELGFGDDVLKALEHVKSLHVPPGKQPGIIRDLAIEAIDYLDEHKLVTVPQLAKDSWRIGMMSPARQRYNPFFTGGSTISVSYPHVDMDHTEKLMSMRGNNPHFSAATVHHELIPGHYLQDFMTSRYNTHRGPYRTVFWTEGWALYWEMLLWDRGFPRGPEDRMGFLFWRMHRCARIIFSLGYHLGELSPEDCVDLLVDIVGHERVHAEGEVRRSLHPGTPTLYQCAYMLGGMQFYVLHHELVKSGKMSAREFHDRILRGNRIPVEMVRAEISDVPLTRDYETNWRFAEEFVKAKPKD